jgi:hypothetical protein
MASPHRPSDMTDRQKVAIAVARFRPRDGPLPAGFDVETLPTYRESISHQGYKVAGWTCINNRTASSTGASTEPEAANVNDPIAANSTPGDQICRWNGCSRSFSGINGPTLLWVSFLCIRNN